MPTWLYKQTDTASPDFAGLWTVGFYTPNGSFEPESDHTSADAAAARVRFLNGGTPTPTERC